ncbi:MAG: YybH family protein [Vicinamibacterales bacterium]
MRAARFIFMGVLILAGVASGRAQMSDAEHIKQWLQGYDAAFVAKDLDKLATFYHPEVTIFEGGGVNRGWVDYRDHHLGPELKESQNLQFSHSNVVVRMLGRDAAYVTADYAIKGRMGERDVDGGGLATLVLIRDGSGWKIRHSHTSSRRRAPASGDAGRPPGI